MTRQSGIDHDPRCKLVPYTRLIAQADLAGDHVPDTVRRLAAEGAGLMDCHPECTVMARAVERGRELAEEHGW